MPFIQKCLNEKPIWLNIVLHFVHIIIILNFIYLSILTKEVRTGITMYTIGSLIGFWPVSNIFANLISINKYKQKGGMPSKQTANVYIETMRHSKIVNRFKLR